jgi:hypothetical protein
MTPDISQLGFLLFVSALVAMLSRRLRMPYTVGLVLAGMGLYFFHIFIKWQLSKELIFSVFLPPLVFEAALFIRWREFKKDLPVVGLLATMGVALAATVTAVGMHYGMGHEATVGGLGDLHVSNRPRSGQSSTRLGNAKPDIRTRKRGSRFGGYSLRHSGVAYSLKDPLFVNLPALVRADHHRLKAQ